MSVDALGVLTMVVNMAFKLKEAVHGVKANQGKCQQLVNRILGIVEVINGEHPMIFHFYHCRQISKKKKNNSPPKFLQLKIDFARKNAHKLFSTSKNPSQKRKTLLSPMAKNHSLKNSLVGTESKRSSKTSIRKLHRYQHITPNVS